MEQLETHNPFVEIAFPYPPVDYAGWLHIATQFAIRGVRECIGAHKKVPDDMQAGVALAVEDYFPVFFESVDETDKLGAVKFRMEMFGFDYGLDHPVVIPKRLRSAGFYRPYHRMGKYRRSARYKAE